MVKFNELGLIPEILKAIDEQKFEEPSEIQAKTIPPAIAGQDIIAGSATGSGKTLAFGAALIQNAVKGAGIQALVLTPTRELAQQINDALIVFSKYKPLKITVVYGGVAIGPQMHALKTADIVIATPGRIIDHLNRGTVQFNKVKTLVLDEADRMLDMGFIDDVKSIIQRCANERQTLLFSATIPEGIRRLTQRYMNDPIKISAEHFVDPKKLKQVYYNTPENLKFSLLVHLLKKEQSGLTMIFCNSIRTVDFVHKNLRSNGIDAHAIHGKFTQQKRSSTLQKFNSKKETSWVLVCTDVAARGLDIPGVSHVYNYDLPHESKQYIHRIGRTARAGEDGKAINLLSEQDHDNFARINRDYDVNIEVQDRPHLERLQTKRLDPPKYRKTHGGGFHKKRPGKFNRRKRNPNSPKPF